MSISERIVYIQQQEGISASKLADLLGIQRSGLSHIYSGRNKPSIDFLQKLSLQYPQYRLEWIINGNKPILKTQIKPDFEENRDLFSQEAGMVLKSEKIASYGLEKGQDKPIIPSKSDSIEEKALIKKELKEIMYIYSDNTFEIFKPVNNK